MKAKMEKVGIKADDDDPKGGKRVDAKPPFVRKASRKSVRVSKGRSSGRR